ncbi:MAG: NAD kinase [Candidatus Nanopelagicaceae bacterium]|nr:NAD kinase [Candidatus Nanopelagicaceae bacterium]
MTAKRSILFIVNQNREDARQSAEELGAIFTSAGFTLYSNNEAEIESMAPLSSEVLSDIEIAIVLGGDGTMLRGAEAVRGTEIPLLGVNLGRVGFLAEVEKPNMSEIADAVISHSYITDQRLVLAYSVERGEKVVDQGWALNEVTIERNETTMVELFVQIDQRPLSRWSCDGLICSTPTGSTAYAFSAGGPIVWPEVQALVVLPISAHALFSKPMVVSPESNVVVDLESTTALLSADSRRKFSLKAGDRVTMTKDTDAVRLAHVKEILFTDRLVAKFKLPIEGWRGE